MADNWISHAIKHKGALHRQLGVPAGQKIPEKRLEAAAKKGGKLGRRARLAETLKRMHGSTEHPHKSLRERVGEKMYPKK